ncbi:unnamed protein product [Camellia sinensis]
MSLTLALHVYICYLTMQTKLPQNSMETPRRKNSSGDKFSFPNILPIQTQDSEFEFGSITPSSPNSPADHLFFNGRLLPHAFPFQPTTTAGAGAYTRSTSRTGSVSSKDSLMSSRSNSSNSRSSSCSTSARTSTSEASDMRRPLNRAKSANKTSCTRDKCQAVLNQQYGSSQRWQFITPVPVLNRQVSRRQSKKGEKKGDNGSGERAGFGRRFLRWFMSACKECHAIEPSKRLQGNM